MPFKLKLIKEFQKNIKSIKDIQETSDKTQDLVEVDNTPKLKNKQRKKITTKNFNFYQLVLRRQPLQARHIVNFYNIVGVNQTAILSNQCEESYLRTLFYLKNVKKIECRGQYILMSLSDSSLLFPPLEYVLERFRSFGDARFYHMAQLMQDVGSRLKAIENLQIRQEKQEGTDFLDKFTESLGNKMYACRISNNKLVISRSLLELLEYEPESFAIETLKFKAPISEVASTEHYYDVMVKYFQNLRNLLDLLSDRITLEAFLDTSVIRFKDYFYTKRNKRIYCKLKVGMPNPMVNIIEVEEVINRSDQADTDHFFGSYRLNEIESFRDNIRRAEIKTVRSLKRLPKNFLPENSRLMTDYIQREEEQSNQAKPNDN